MRKLAIQEQLLPGTHLRQRLAKAAELGFGGVEFLADELDGRVPEIYGALQEHNLAASGVNMGKASGWLSADRRLRADSADMLRRALTCALDLGAEYVTFVPHYGLTDLPDLTPFASPMDLQKELLIWLLRGISDLADAMDSKLAILPVNRSETTFLTRLEDAAFFRREVGDHPNITIAANSYHMALEERDSAECLVTHGEAISVVYLADDNRCLPGLGTLSFAAIGSALCTIDYCGWLVLEGSPHEDKPAQASELVADLEECLDYLRRCNVT